MFVGLYEQHQTASNMDFWQISGNMALLLLVLINSTEYSGPKGVKMVAQNAKVVTGCGHHDDVGAAEIGEQK